MKKDIHPKYEEITASCSCGNVMKIRALLQIVGGDKLIIPFC